MKYNFIWLSSMVTVFSCVADFKIGFVKNQSDLQIVDAYYEKSPRRKKITYLSPKIQRARAAAQKEIMFNYSVGAASGAMNLIEAKGPNGLLYKIYLKSDAAVAIALKRTKTKHNGKVVCTGQCLPSEGSHCANVIIEKDGIVEFCMSTAYTPDGVNDVIANGPIVMDLVLKGSKGAYSAQLVEAN